MIKLFHKFLKINFFILLLFVNVSFANPVKIDFWHSLAGSYGEELHYLATRFNQQQNEYFLNPIYKGDYVECITSLAAAFRAKQAPPLVQIFEVGSESMLNPSGIIEPVEKLMKKHRKKLNKQDYFPILNKYYSQNGQLMAMPFNVSIPVLFYNKDALKKAGIQDKELPQTWHDLERISGLLQEHGYDCVFSSANPAWILIEATASIHGLSLVDQKTNQALYNNRQTRTLLTKLKDWQNRKIFEYGGRSDDSSILFTSGRCPFYAQSSGAFNSLSQFVNFDIGIISLPINTEVSKTRHSNIAGGGALWVLSGHDEKTYEGVSQFLEFILHPDNQLRWHQKTGYLPLGVKGDYQSIIKQSTHPSLHIASHDFIDESLGLKNDLSRVHNQIRVINEESLEAVFSGIKTPKEALDNAVLRSNHALERFKKNTI